MVLFYYTFSSALPWKNKYWKREQLNDLSLEGRSPKGVFQTSFVFPPGYVDSTWSNDHSRGWNTPRCMASWHRFKSNVYNEIRAEWNRLRPASRPQEPCVDSTWNAMIRHMTGRTPGFPERAPNCINHLPGGKLTGRGCSGYLGDPLGSPIRMRIEGITTSRSIQIVERRKIWYNMNQWTSMKLCIYDYNIWIWLNMCNLKFANSGPPRFEKTQELVGLWKICHWNATCRRIWDPKKDSNGNNCYQYKRGWDSQLQDAKMLSQVVGATGILVEQYEQFHMNI